MHPTTHPARGTWTILSLIEWGKQYLHERGFEDSRLNIELLLCHTLHLTRINLYTSFDRPLSATELAEFKVALRRRLTHEPLQYIVGETEFMGITLYVNPSVLIPRPETEELVQKALEWIKGLNSDRVDILDVGTGSGNIPIAIERFSSNTHVTSIDVSADALDVAARNIDRHKCARITLKQQDVFDMVGSGRTWDLIIANPPYISTEEFATLQPEVRDFEPAIATTDNADGLRFIRRICGLAAETLNDRGVLFMEVAYNQGAAAKRIASESGLVEVEISKDVSGNERMLQGRRAA
ncbi:MAG: peptide release factor-glutamine N5-methyltransferase [Bacteroidetes bacterium]|nr:peptide release factor-glutamine N5-methyltransferase [Bacteroidota bacterium]